MCVYSVGLGMISRLCFVYAVLCVIAFMVLSVFLRDANNRMFNELRNLRADHNQLTQQLRQKQLTLEQLINPNQVLKQLNNSIDSQE